MIQLAKPYIPERAISSVVEVIQSGRLVQGEWVLKFEQVLKDYIGAGHAVLVSSCTAALHLALVAAGVKPGDEVILPAFTFPATANVVELVGAKPIFVDIDLEDYCIAPYRIKEKISAKTKAIMPVHEFGQPADMETIIDIAGRYGLKIIEDAACALGSEYKGKKIGNFGIAGCFSFHPRKAITTGEGGLIVTNDEKVADRLRIMRNHGIVLTNQKIDFVEAGFNFRMTEMQAALGYNQLEHMNAMIDHRKMIAMAYNESLSSIQWIRLPRILENRKMVFQSYHILFEQPYQRGQAMAALKSNGIESNIGAYALNGLSYYKSKYCLKDDDFPNAVSAYRRGLVLPMGNHLQVEDVEYIASIFRELKNV